MLADVAVSREHASAMDTSNDDAIATFIAFTGADNQMAAQFLQMANNDVEMAASLFFAAAEGGPAPGEDDPMDGGGESQGEDDGSDYDDALPAMPAADEPPPPVPMPHKRQKVELRPGPTLPNASAALLATLQQTFALKTKPADAGDALHKTINERYKSWAHDTDDRGLAYLCQCWLRAKAAAEAAGGEFTLSGEAVGGGEGGYPMACALHHARTLLLSGEATDDGLSLFEEAADESELVRLLRIGGAAASAFLSAVNASMTDAEADQVNAPNVETLLTTLQAAQVPPPGGAAPGGASSSTSKEWQAAYREAEGLLGLEAKAGGGEPAKKPHGLGARAALARRMNEEAALMRNGKWSGRDAEANGALRLFSPAAPGLLGNAGQPARVSAKPTVHHEDDATIGQTQREISELRARQRGLFTAALLKDKGEEGNKKAALSWAAATLAANLAPPSQLKETDHASLKRTKEILRKRASDGSLTNLGAVVLALCEPFAGGDEKAAKAHANFSRLDARWFAREALKAAGNKKAAAEPSCRDVERVAAASGEANTKAQKTAAKAFGVDDEEEAEAEAEAAELAQALALSSKLSPGQPAAAAAGAVVAAEAPTIPEDFHFVTECFFLGVRALHHAILPAMDMLAAQTRALISKHKAPSYKGLGPGELDRALQQLTAAGFGPINTAIVAYRAAVEGERLCELVGRFVILVGAWLTHLAATPPPAAPAEPPPPSRTGLTGDVAALDVATANDVAPIGAAAFALLPAYVVCDLGSLLENLAFSPDGPALLARPDLGFRALVSRAVCGLLGRRDLLTSPFVRLKLCDALHAFVQIDEHKAKVRGGGGGGFFGGGNLFDLVDGDAACEVQLAIMSLYTELGLHTNTTVGGSDKNGQRMGLMKVLRKIWDMPAAWGRCLQLAAASAENAGTVADTEGFGGFAETLVKELIFLLNDALGRLADLKAVQDEMADEETWAKQPEKTRKEREHAAAGLQRTAKGFLSLAKASLNALLFLTRDGQACAAFTSVASRAKKMAALLYKFFDTLCGPAMSTLKVKEKEKVGWNPQEMLRNTAQLLLQCATHTPQMVATFAAVDGFDASLLPKARRILAEKCNFPPHQTEQLDAIVATLHSGSGGGGGASSSADGEGAGGEGAAALAAMLAEVAAAKAAEAESGKGPAALLESVNAAYTDALEDLTFSAEGEMQEKDSAGNETGRYRHHYRQNIADTPFEMTSRAKAKRLNHELRGLAKPGTLPAAAEGCAFVVKDEARSDVLKVLISGPSDVHDVTRETPYGMGLFLFDFFCPAEYPEKAPVVNLMTTGDGLVRFNPNLYSDGKVCLSLIGTWHGGSAAEGWQVPSSTNAGSTILQVIMSIQSLIMVPKPYFNEPAYEVNRGTPAGEKQSSDYNENLRLQTMRYAMRDMIKKPPPDFEEVVKAHFRAVRPLLLRQCARWLEESTTKRREMEKVIGELVPLLDALEEEGSRDCADPPTAPKPTE